MRSVGLKVLKNKLSEYVRLVEGGESVLITNRDRVIAEIVPPREGRSTTIDDVELAEAVRNGLVTPPALRVPGAPEGDPVAPLAEILEQLEADRRDR